MWGPIFLLCLHRIDMHDAPSNLNTRSVAPHIVAQSPPAGPENKKATPECLLLRGTNRGVRARRRGRIWLGSRSPVMHDRTSSNWYLTSPRSVGGVLVESQETTPTWPAVIEVVARLDTSGSVQASYRGRGHRCHRKRLGISGRGRRNRTCPYVIVGGPRTTRNSCGFWRHRGVRSGTRRWSASRSGRVRGM